ncbi:hypothetical protein M2418_003525 [Rhizobium sp. BIGb0125]|nr:hypothetical protein [Rhizobium sp. BIGb0125]
MKLIADAETRQILRAAILGIEGGRGNPKYGCNERLPPITDPFNARHVPTLIGDLKSAS